MPRKQDCFRLQTDADRHFTKPGLPRSFLRTVHQWKAHLDVVQQVHPNNGLSTSTSTNHMTGPKPSQVQTTGISKGEAYHSPYDEDITTASNRTVLVSRQVLVDSTPLQKRRLGRKPQANHNGHMISCSSHEREGKA